MKWIVFVYLRPRLNSYPLLFLCHCYDIQAFAQSLACVEYGVRIFRTTVLYGLRLLRSELIRPTKCLLLLLKI